MYSNREQLGDRITGYATDGYARVKGIGAMVTTGGVGELSAINAHAGAYSEQTAVIHIVGSPALSIRGNKQFQMHHTLGDNDYDVFKNIFKPVSAEQVTLMDASRAPGEIDHILQTCWVSSRPVYIDIPADMANKVVDGSRLLSPLSLSFPSSDTQQQDEALAALLSKLIAAQNPCILVDMGAARQRVSHVPTLIIVYSIDIGDRSIVLCMNWFRTHVCQPLSHHLPRVSSTRACQALEACMLGAAHIQGSKSMWSDLILCFTLGHWTRMSRRISARQVSGGQPS